MAAISRTEIKQLKTTKKALQRLASKAKKEYLERGDTSFYIPLTNSMETMTVKKAAFDWYPHNTFAVQETTVAPHKAGVLEKYAGKEVFIIVIDPEAKHCTCVKFLIAEKV